MLILIGASCSKSSTGAASVSQGKVLAINSAYHFVIISLGQQDNVQANTVLTVQRDGKPIGKVQVSQIQDQTSVANDVASSFDAGTEPQPGDIVIFSGS
jgi:hypothetical protein